MTPPPPTRTPATATAATPPSSWWSRWPPSCASELLPAQAAPERPHRRRLIVQPHEGEQVRPVEAGEKRAAWGGLVSLAGEDQDLDPPLAPFPQLAHAQAGVDRPLVDPT